MFGKFEHGDRLVLARAVDATHNLKLPRLFGPVYPPNGGFGKLSGVLRCDIGQQRAFMHKDRNTDAAV